MTLSSLLTLQVCCICLAKYANNDELRELPCSHLFHKECVDKWLKINALCPLCKNEVGDSLLSSLAGATASLRRAESRVVSSWGGTGVVIWQKHPCFLQHQHRYICVQVSEPFAGILCRISPSTGSCIVQLRLYCCHTWCFNSWIRSIRNLKECQCW